MICYSKFFQIEEEGLGCMGGPGRTRVSLGEKGGGASGALRDDSSG